MNLTLLIPAMNEAESLNKVLADIDKSLFHEVIVIDGHSTDSTVEIVKKYNYKVITQDGKGYGDSVLCGLKHATGSHITMIDADGSYRLSDIPRLKEVVESGYDLAFGSRYLPESYSYDDTISHYLGNKLFTFIFNILFGLKLTDSLYLFMIIDKRKMEAMSLKCKGFGIIIEFLVAVAKQKYTFREIPCTEEKRIAGKPKMNPIIDGLNILITMLKYKFCRK